MTVLPSTRRPRYGRTLLLLGFLSMTGLPVHCLNAQTDAPRPEEIYLLIGQSNMAGRAPLLEQDLEPVPGCWLLNEKDEWEPARNPLNLYSTVRKQADMQKMGPGYGFALTLRNEFNSPVFGLVVNAKGGTNIDLWMKDHPKSNFYAEAVRRARVAESKGGVLAGILWHQGEANANDPGYLKKLERLISDLRMDLENPALPFVAGQVFGGRNPQVNDRIAELPDKVPHTAAVHSAGLKVMDNWHFDRESMLELGQRYAAALWSLRNKN